MYIILELCACMWILLLVCDQAYWLYGADMQAYPHYSSFLLVLYCYSTLATCFLRTLYRSDIWLNYFLIKSLYCVWIYFVEESVVLRTWSFQLEHYDNRCFCACNHIKYKQWHISEFSSSICQHHLFVFIAVTTYFSYM